MVAGTTFPGVYTQEQDFSLYIPAITTTKFGIVTTASKGPVNQRVLCASVEQMVNAFGFPGTAYKGLVAAQQYFRQGNQCVIVRVAGYDEEAGQLIIRNSANTANALTLTAVESGSWVNGSKGLTCTISKGDMLGTYTIRFLWNGALVETQTNVNLTPHDDNFVETRLASSKFATAVWNGQTTLALGSGTFSDGDDGRGVTAADYVGVISSNSKTGLQMFSDGREVDINVIAVPGISNKDVVTELIALAENRQDCFALVDPPYGLNESEIVDWHNGVLNGDIDYPTATLNSSYAAVFWPWVQVFDSYNNENIWAPPSGFAAQNFALTDRDFGQWFAPAGFKRGRIQQALATEMIPTEGGGAFMYGGNSGSFGVNAVNPIMSFIGEGTVIWGQRTLQREPTALDRINVRRSLLYLRKVIASAVRFLTFDPNDEQMWSDFRNLVSPFLRQIQAGRGIRDFQVIMDATTNTATVEENNQALGRILLIPTKSAEVINIAFALLPQGANFTDFVTTSA